jgi:hypothetical protein
VEHVGDRSAAYRGFVGRPEGKGTLGKPKCSCKDNIKMDL